MLLLLLLLLLLQQSMLLLLLLDQAMFFQQPISVQRNVLQSGDLHIFKEENNPLNLAGRAVKFSYLIESKRAREICPII